MLPKPYFESDNCVIYNADCRDILPVIPAVDLVVTDPPYGINYISRQRKFSFRRIIGDKRLPVDLIWLAISKAKAAAYVFTRWDMLHAMPAPKSVIAWVKNNHSMGDTRHEHGRKWEACCFYPMAEHKFTRRPPDVFEAKLTGNKLHPTQKPVDLLERIITHNVGDVVLDPFMGSGSTLVAALKCGRKAIGVELDEEYCEAAARRLEDAESDA